MAVHAPKHKQVLFLFVCLFNRKYLFPLFMPLPSLYYILHLAQVNSKPFDQDEQATQQLEMLMWVSN